MNLSEIRDYVREYLDLTSADISDTLINRWANEGQRQVLNSRPRWPHLEATASFTTLEAVATYTISADLRTVLAVDCVEVGPLSVIDEAEAKAVFWTASGPSSGQPQAISLWAGGIRVWPVPDATEYTIEIQGMRPAVAMTSTADPDLPSDLHDAVLEWVMHKAYLQQDDPEMAQVHASLFSQTLTMFGEQAVDIEDAAPMVFGGGFTKRSGLGSVSGPAYPSFGTWSDLSTS